jgi:hypothetical protein
MKTQYGISGAVLAALRRRDENCVYCDVLMPDRKDSANGCDYATIEHLYPPGNDPTWVSWCCNGCNSRHKKPLREWFSSPYCVERCINENTVAPIIKQFLDSGLKEFDQVWLGGREDQFLKCAAWSEPSQEGQQSIQRRMLSQREIKSFDLVLTAVRTRRYAFDFRGLAAGMFGRYCGFMYWPEGEILNRMPFPD